MSAPRIVARNYTEASRFAIETLGLAPNTFRTITTVGGLAGYGYTLHLAPGWSKAPYSHAIRNKIKFKRGIEVIDHDADVQKESTRKVEDAPDISTVETDDNPVEMRHCEGCGEDYNAFEESHIGHETPEPEPEETDDETGTTEPGEDAEGAEEQPKRRRRRCKICGVLVEPDDVEAHAAQHEEE